MSDKNILKLTLDKLEVKELVDLGTFLDKQDLQLSIKVGNKPQHTKRYIDLSFPNYLIMCIIIVQILQNNPSKIIIYLFLYSIIELWTKARKLNLLKFFSMIFLNQIIIMILRYPIRL